MKLHCFLILWLILPLYCTSMRGAQQSSAPHVLTFFFKPAFVEFCDSSTCKETLSHLAIPGHINRTILNQKLLSPLISGIYVTYRGLIAHSDFNGQVSFPLQHITNTYTLAVTNAIRPVLLFSNTVNHLEFVEHNPVQMYELTRTQQTEPKKINQWTIKKIPQPANTRIPDEAIVIISRPSGIIIIEGTFPADEGPHVILPHVYVTNKLQKSIDTLQFIKNLKFLAPVIEDFGYTNERYAVIIAN